MANSIITTNRTIEVSEIDSDYMMPPKTNVQSVVFIPGDNKFGNDEVYIVEDSPHDTDPIKCFLNNDVDGKESRMWIFNQRLRLGFVYNAMVIFFFFLLHYNHRVTNVRIGVWTPEMKMKLSQQTAVL